MDSTHSKDETEVITPEAKYLLKSKDGKFALFGFFMVTLMSIGRVVLHEVHHNKFNGFFCYSLPLSHSHK